MCARLLRDTTGNVLAIAGASLIPLMALIGGGVDVSRAYMAKTQLQSACDSGVLAGRKAMSKSGSYGDDEKAKADAMFDFNFDGAALDVRNVSYATHDNDDGQVLGTATAELPTLVMKIFDLQTVDLSVDCMAELQIGNADVMFVLDTTGSMGSPISWGEDDKIVGLRDAVRDFHKTINQAVNDTRTRIRYGFVPYSMTVNAKQLLVNGDMPYDYFADTSHYQSRIAVFTTPNTVVDEVEDLGTDYQTYPYRISERNCDSYGENRYPYWSDNPQVVDRTATTVTTIEYSRYSYNRRSDTCVRTAVKKKTYYTTSGYKFSYWRYQRQALDTAQLKTFGSVPIATDVSSAVVDTAGEYDLQTLAQMNAHTAANGVDASGVGVSNVTWDGCLEARQTVEPMATVRSFDPIPDGAFDLRIDLVPDSDETRWKPHWSTVEFTRSSWGGNYDSEQTTTTRNPISNSCPAPMKLLTEVALSSDPNNIPGWLNSYLNNLNPEGNTYHDIGMVWGGRLTSPNGIFGTNVNKDADKINVSRHIIFMTDGIMEPTASGYSAYGIENLDNRISPRDYEGTLKERHTARFNAVCEEIKAQGTTIWVIAFGTSMTDSLRDCASDGRAYYSSNSEQLRNTFKYIAAQVADLRLGA